MVEKILITGCNGLLGQKLIHELTPHFNVFGSDLHDSPFWENDAFKYYTLDIAKRNNLTEVIQKLKPDFIVNAAAYTNVDKAEAEREQCWQANVIGVENLVYAAKKNNARIIQISTDYVFDGKNGPYREGDSPNAEGFYAKSKLAAENVIVGSNLQYTIVRTMILFGVGVNLRPNFVDWLVNALRKRQAVTIVDDQIGNPTLADDLAGAILRIIREKAVGLYHIAGSELLDRYQFALKIADVFNLDKSLITPIKTSQLKQKAPRPLNSGFIIEKAETYLGIEMRNVESALKEFKRQFD